jgi:protein-arginine kinase activator protein McsA
MNDLFFPLTEDKSFSDFFEKYDNFISLYEIDIKDFPIEKLLKFSIELYEMIQNDELNLQVEKLDFPFKIDEDEIKGEIEKTIKDTFIDIFEEEIKNDEIKDKTLTNYRKDIIIKGLEEEMDEFVLNEEYEKAAKIRDEIKNFLI